MNCGRWKRRSVVKIRACTHPLRRALDRLTPPTEPSCSNGPNRSCSSKDRMRPARWTPWSRRPSAPEGWSCVVAPRPAGRPYQSVADALAPLLAAHDDAALAGALAPIVAPDPPAPGSDPAFQRFQAFESVARVLAGHAARQPLVVVLEDDRRRGQRRPLTWSSISLVGEATLRSAWSSRAVLGRRAPSTRICADSRSPGCCTGSRRGRRITSRPTTDDSAGRARPR